MKKLAITMTALVLAACSTEPVRYEGVKANYSGLTEMLSMSPETKTSIDALQDALMKLGANVSRADAQALAKEAHTYPLHLANVWQVAPTPLLQNILRNYDKREYGLCIDWTYAMRERMRGLGLDSFDWYWGIANEGSDWREHSTLVAVAKGQPFDTGIILDPWRNSGKLFWSRTNGDAKYNWKKYDEPEGWTPSRMQSGL